MDITHQFEGVGTVLFLKETPIIKAIYSPYNLQSDDNIAESTMYKFALTREYQTPTWEDIFQNLRQVAKKLGLVKKNHPNTLLTPIHTLMLLTDHLGTKEIDTETLQIFYNKDHDLDPTFEQLFHLSKMLNDGHDIQVLVFTGVHYCNQPDFQSFYAECVLVSEEYSRRFSSQELLFYMLDIYKGLGQSGSQFHKQSIAELVTEHLSGIQSNKSYNETVQYLIQSLRASLRTSA